MKTCKHCGETLEWDAEDKVWRGDYYDPNCIKNIIADLNEFASVTGLHQPA